MTVTFLQIVNILKILVSGKNVIYIHVCNALYFFLCEIFYIIIGLVAEETSMVCVHNRVLLGHEKWNLDVFSVRDYHEVK